MDTEKNQFDKSSAPEEKKRLSVWAQILLFVLIPVLSFGYASGVLGEFGLPALILAASLNVILALELEDSIPKLLVLLFINLAPFVGITLYTMSVAASASALFVIALAFPIWLTLRMGLGRSTSIVFSAIGAMAVLCFILANDVIISEGALGTAEINSYFDKLVAPLGQALSEISLEENGKSIQLFTSADINNMLYYFKSMLLGGMAVVMIIWAYLTTLAVRLISSKLGTAWRLPGSLRVLVSATVTEEGPKLDISHEPVIWRIEITSVSAAVYLIVYVLNLFSGGAANLFGAVILNLFIILSPGFLYFAVRDTVLSVRRKTAGRKNLWPVIICAAFIFFNPGIAVYILCALGAVYVIRDNGVRRNSEKMRKG